MKRLIPILLALTILIPSSAGLYAWGVVGMSGGVAGGAPAGCDLNNDSNQIDPSAVLTADGDHSATSTVYLWQAFTTTVAITVTRIDVLMYATGSDGSCSIEINTNNAGVPSGTLVSVGASKTLACSVIQQSIPAWVTFELTTPCDLAATTLYHIVMKGVTTGYLIWRTDSTGGYSGGVAGYYSGGWGPYTGEDLPCIVWGCTL